MILTRDRILKLIKKGKIKIKPFNEENVGPASIDLSLSDEFRIFNKKTIDPKEFNYLDITKLVKKDKIILKPNQLILGITRERITLPDNIAGILEGRSKFARLGLLVHMTSSFVHPGIDNKQVLEIKNGSNSYITLYKGLKICQLVLMETRGKAHYIGEFQKQNNL